MKNKLPKIIRFLFGLTSLSLALGQLTRLQLGLQTGLYFHDFLIGIFIGVWLVQLVVTKHRPILDKVQLSGLFCMGVFFVSWLVNLAYWQQASMFGLFYWFRFGVYLLFFIAVADCFKTKIISGSVKQILLKSGVLLAIAGILQFVLLPDTRFLYQFGWDDHLNRVISLHFDPSFTSIFLVLTLLIFLRRHEYRPLVLIIVALALTYSRASYLVVIFILGANWWLDQKNKVNVFLIALFIWLIAFLPQTQGEGVNLVRTQSIVSRTHSSGRAIDIFRSHPVLGIGFNNFRLTQTASLKPIPSHVGSPDNSFVFTLVTTGVLGMISLLWFLYLLGKAALRSKDHIAFLSLLAVMTHSLANNTLYYPFILLWILLLFTQLEAT